MIAYLRLRWRKAILSISRSMPLQCECLLILSPLLPAPLNHDPDSLRQLYKILFHIIDSLYGQNLDCGESLDVAQMVGPLFSGEHQLMDWERLLPSNLKTISSQQIVLKSIEKLLQDDDYIVLRLRTILTLRYLNLCLLLHRPILTKFLDVGNSNINSPDLRLLQQVGSNSLKVCVQSSIEIISIVHAAVQKTDGSRSLLGAWWFALYYSKSPLPMHFSRSGVS